jgi:lysophospholipase L1-like esterase
VRVLKIVGVFACVSLFWARWTNPEVFRFLLATVRRTVQPQDVLRIAAALAAAVAVGVAVQFLLQRSKARRQDTFSSLERRPFTARSVAFERSVALHLVPMILVLLTVQPEVHTLFGRSASELLARLKTDQPAGAEALAAVEGYYERLQCLQSGPWLNSPAPDPSRQTAAAEYEALTRPADLLLEVELIPGAEGTLDGSPISINQWGMRDRRTITLSKPRGTTRIALVGSSVVMGYGVADEDVFGRLLEAKLNEGQSGRDGRYEVLNFAVGKHYAVHRRVLLDRKVLAFQPDAVFYFAHQEELYYPARQLAELVAKGAALPDACLREVLDRAGVTTDMAWGQIASLLGGRDEEILRCLYGSFARTCREHGAVPVWAYLPIPGVPDDPPDPSAALLKLAAESRFVVLDLSDWAEGYALTEIKAEADDQHPNAFGHQRISEALWGVLERNPGALPRGE